MLKNQSIKKSEKSIIDFQLKQCIKNTKIYIEHLNAKINFYEREIRKLENDGIKKNSKEIEKYNKEIFNLYKLIEEEINLAIKDF